MFTLNGNRRPNSIATAYVKVPQRAAIVKSNISALMNKILKSEPVFSESSLLSKRQDVKVDFTSVKWKASSPSFKVDTHHILYNLEEKDKNIVLHIYAIPKEAVIGKPKQDLTNFNAIIHPTAHIEDLRKKSDPIITVFKNTADGKFYKSHTEVLVAVKGDESLIAKVKAVVVNEIYFEIAQKIEIEDFDLSSNRIEAYNTGSVVKNRTLVVDKTIKGLPYNVALTKSVTTLKDGAYSVIGVVNGVIFIETTNSLVSDDVRTVHFFANGSDQYKKIVKKVQVQNEV